MHILTLLLTPSEIYLQWSDQAPPPLRILVQETPSDTRQGEPRETSGVCGRVRANQSSFGEERLYSLYGCLSPNPQHHS